MGDLVWFIIIGVLFAALAVAFLWFGWQIRKYRKIDLIISYHCDKVTEENKPAYCALFGSGMLLMGAGFGISAIFVIFSQSAVAFVPMAVGLVVGTVLLTAAVVRYNR